MKRRMTNMQEVWLVYVIYHDGYNGTEVYSTKEKACGAADQLVFEFQQDGYTIADGYDDIVFSKDMINDVDFIRLVDKHGEVEITVEKKIVR
jgi:hypothetical protein